jgi:hypothetical protein
MSPLTYPDPCPHLVEGEHGIYVCAIYHSSRPKQCVDHNFVGYNVCPIGREVLNIHDVNQVAAREMLIEKVSTND